MQSAVKPLVVVEKQDFRPDAEPIWSVRWREFSVDKRWEDGSSSGPERGMEGRFQDDRSEGLGLSEGLREGGEPIIPPSMSLTREGVSLVNRAAISRAERGDMALRSR